MPNVNRTRSGTVLTHEIEEALADEAEAGSGYDLGAAPTHAHRTPLSRPGRFPPSRPPRSAGAVRRPTPTGQGGAPERERRRQGRPPPIPGILTAPVGRRSHRTLYRHPAGGALPNVRTCQKSMVNCDCLGVVPEGSQPRRGAVRRLGEAAAGGPETQSTSPWAEANHDYALPNPRCLNDEGHPRGRSPAPFP